MSRELRAVLVAEGGLVAAALGPDAPPDDGPLHAAAVREGQRLHAGAARVVTGAEPDLALLAGDRLYALGLERLAAAGDLDGIAALAEVISRCAQAQADGDSAAAEAAWERLARRADGAMARPDEPPD
ncbi:MAG TPA: hypothetical protein VGJ32_09710 [Solirubrobacteraceae bacterium]|jgi:hypothetical protein